MLSNLSVQYVTIVVNYLMFSFATFDCVPHVHGKSFSLYLPAMALHRY